MANIFTLVDGTSEKQKMSSNTEYANFMEELETIFVMMRDDNMLGPLKAEHIYRCVQDLAKELKTSEGIDVSSLHSSPIAEGNVDFMYEFETFYRNIRKLNVAGSLEVGAIRQNIQTLLKELDEAPRLSG